MEKSGTARDLSFNVEADVPAQTSQSFFDDTSSRIFPLDLFKCCPVVVRALVPRTCQKIQDCTHLILVMGALSCLILAVSTIYRLPKLEPLQMPEEILSLVFVAFCISYLFGVIGQYDDRLSAKQRDAKEQKANLTRSYNELLTDMDGLLTKSAESSAGLAERSFESKRRDFQRFLERAKNKYSSNYSGMKGDSDKLLIQFRRFCVNWLAVFEECSIDPVNIPKRVVTAEELNRCTSIVDVADLCLERLRVTEVRFISIQRDQDAQMLRRNRNEFRRLSTPLALPTTVSDSPRPVPIRQQTSGGGPISWLTFGRGYGWKYSQNDLSEDYFPKEYSFGCGRLVVLSREHARLTFCFGVGWLILALQITTMMKSKRWRLTDVSSVVVAQVCLMTTLLKFEEIDIIQQLEREVKELARQNEHVEKQREKMHEFWSNAQQLTELWLYRTVPRLDLYKEVHSLLEDTEEDLLMKISSANQQLEELDHSLGALQAWRGGGSLTIDEKKTFGKAINQLCQEQEFDSILLKLEEVTTNGMKSMQALK